MPIRVHMASGKTLDITDGAAAWLLQNSLLVMRRLEPGSQATGGFDEVAYRLIERIEQLVDEPTAASE